MKVDSVADALSGAIRSVYIRSIALRLRWSQHPMHATKGHGMRADARANRRDLLESAWRLIAEQGAEVSLRTIATEAGVGIGTLYRHFPTRGDLAVGLFEEVWARIEKVATRRERGWADAPREAWEEFVRDLAGLGLGALAYQLAPFAEADQELSTAVMHARERILAQARAILGPPLARAAEIGAVEPGIEIPQFMVGLAAATRPLPRAVREQLPGQEAWLVETYIRGLRPDATRR